MSLYVCDECGVIENTALANYWLRFNPDREVKSTLCSQCDPAIGKWHGKFPRTQYDGSQEVVNR